MVAIWQFGYTSSNKVKYDEKEIASLSVQNNANSNLSKKDAIMLKLNKNGNYEWGVRFGGTRDDEIRSVIETTKGNFVVVGNYYSKTLNLYNSGNLNSVKATLTNAVSNNNTPIKNGFVVAYSLGGNYEWSANITNSSSNTEAVDVAEYSNGLAVAVNQGTIAYLYKYNLSTGAQIGRQMSYGSNTKITSLEIENKRKN